MEQNEEQFVSGFNNGYLLAKFEPLLISQLLINAKPVNNYIKGLSCGQNEFILERENEIGNLRIPPKERNIERE